MPPAFLFPESDPPPSDLIPDHQSSTGQNIDAEQKANFNGKNNGQGESPMVLEDTPDASPIPSKNNKHHAKFGIEEYTLPDLFPTPSSHHANFFSQNNNKGEQHPNNNSNGQVQDFALNSSEMVSRRSSWVLLFHATKGMVERERESECRLIALSRRMSRAMAKDRDKQWTIDMSVS